MISLIFSVYDKATQAYLPPFYAPTQGSALRSFLDALTDPNHQFSKHSADYTLFHIGSFDDATGVFTQEKTHKKLGVAHELKASQENISPITRAKKS